jgi:tripartite-type tricarboxylate transporter receptor subunit TctC
MKLARRRVLRLAAGAVAFPALSRLAWAESYPVRPVHVSVGYPAGGTADVLARLIVQWLSERLGQPFIIDNRPGAATNIATETVAKAPPDGYTLLLVTTANAINASLYEKLGFDFLRDIAPVAGLIRTPNVMEVNPSFPAKTVPEFIAYAKANPGKLNYAAPSGSPPHVAGELFKMMAGVDMVHVPYRGSGPALNDLIGGRVQVMFDNIVSSIGQIRAGAVRPLAVTTAARQEVLPDIPTVGDFVPGYEASGWLGVGAPKATPAAIVAMLNREINAGLADPAMKTRLADLGGTPMPGPAAGFGKLIADETVKWSKVIKFAGIKPD